METIKPTGEVEGIRVYDLKEVAEKLATTPRNLHTKIKNGELKAIKLKNRYLVSEENLKQFLNGK